VKHWSEPYVGIPFRAGGRDASGVDCWGLCCLVYHDVLQIDLNDFAGRYVTAEERDDISALVSGERALGPWVDVSISDAADFDILLFREFGLESHVGIVAGRGLVLHATAGRLSGIERYGEGRWLPRLTGIYRHRMRA
jgi:probable lipoprotein NlpC